MSHAHAVLRAEERALIAEEESLFERARAAIDRADERRARETVAERTQPSELRSIAALRDLREEAKAASEDDLPALLLELSVRQRLVQRPTAAPLPDREAPYFAHLRVRESLPGGRTAVKDYLLGSATLLDTSAGVRIVDWRVAPVAKIFYRQREGDAYEESFPGREVEGTVEARRILVFAHGRLSRIVLDGMTLARDDAGEWQRAPGATALAAGGAGTAVRPGRPIEVTALLDREQYAAIHAPAEQPLVVLGSAGSGKTTVALHRLARLAAEDPARYALERAAVIVPEEGLARLSRRLLAPLGAAATQVQTLDGWAEARARRVFGKLPRLWRDAPGVVVALKRHPALHDALRDRFAKLAPAQLTLARLRKRLADAFTDRTFLADVVERARGDLSRSVVEETVRHTMQQLAEPLKVQLRSVTDAARKRAIDGRTIDAATPDELAGTIDVEDLPILLFVAAWRAKADEAHEATLAHLVVDEAEDFSLFELFVLGRQLAFPPSVTLSGDEAQQTSSAFAGWARCVEALGTADALTCRLEISYRCPRPVVEIARVILGPLANAAATTTARAGVPVGGHVFPEEAHAQLFLTTVLRDLVDREPDAAIAVLTHDDETAVRLFEIVQDVPATRLVRGGDFSFEPGVDIASVDDAKGLEFDYVIVPDATAAAYPLTNEARRRLHVAATRTSHQLWILAGGAPTPILQNAPLWKSAMA